MRLGKQITLAALLILVATATAFSPQLVRFEWTYDGTTSGAGSVENIGSADYFILYSSDEGGGEVGAAGGGAVSAGGILS